MGRWKGEEIAYSKEKKKRVGMSKEFNECLLK